MEGADDIREELKPGEKKRESIRVFKDPLEVFFSTNQDVIPVLSLVQSAPDLIMTAWAQARHDYIEYRSDDFLYSLIGYICTSASLGQDTETAIYDALKSCVHSDDIEQKNEYSQDASEEFAGVLREVMQKAQEIILKNHPSPPYEEYERKRVDLGYQLVNYARNDEESRERFLRRIGLEQDVEEVRAVQNRSSSRHQVINTTPIEPGPAGRIYRDTRSVLLDGARLNVYEPTAPEVSVIQAMDGFFEGIGYPRSTDDVTRFEYFTGGAVYLDEKYVDSVEYTMRSVRDTDNSYYLAHREVFDEVFEAIAAYRAQEKISLQSEGPSDPSPPPASGGEKEMERIHGTPCFETDLFRLVGDALDIGTLDRMVTLTHESPEYEVLTAIDRFLDAINYPRTADDPTRIVNVPDPFEISENFAHNLRNLVIGKHKTSPDFKKYPDEVAGLFQDIKYYEMTRGFMHEFDPSEMNVSTVIMRDAQQARRKVAPTEVVLTKMKGDAETTPMFKHDGRIKIVYLEGFGRDSGITPTEAEHKSKDEMAKQLTCIRRMIGGDNIHRGSGDKGVRIFDTYGVSFNNSYYDILSEYCRQRANPNYVTEKASILTTSIFGDIIPDLREVNDPEERTRLLDEMNDHIYHIKFINYSYGTSLFKQMLVYLEVMMKQNGLTQDEIDKALGHIVHLNYATLVDISNDTRSLGVDEIYPDGVVENRTDNLEAKKFEPREGIEVGQVDSIKYYYSGNRTVLYPTKRTDSIGYITYDDEDMDFVVSVSERKVPGHQFHAVQASSGTLLDDPLRKVVPMQPAANVMAKILRFATAMIDNGDGTYDLKHNPEQVLQWLRGMELRHTIHHSVLTWEDLRAKVEGYRGSEKYRVD